MNQDVLEAKKATVATLKDDLKNANAFVVVEYRGLTVEKLMQLRRDLRGVNAKMGVFKNSLVERALEDHASEELKATLHGPNAFIFCEDVCAGPKVLRKFARQNDQLVIKGGLLEGSWADPAKIDEIAKLPGKDGVISMFLSVLQAPVRGLACALKAIADGKQA